MAATKSSSSFTWASGSATASGTTNPISCSTDYVQELYVSIVQVGSASTAATFTPQWSPDGTTYYSGQTYTAPLTAVTTNWTIAVPVTAEDVQIVYTAQSGGTSSTLTAQLGQVTGV
ncbi:MAG: hypothetical protein ACLQIB_11570 [Isosphaeraceae bacterium]